jgi:hypothetical protein
LQLLKDPDGASVTTNTPEGSGPDLPGEQRKRAAELAGGCAS